MRGRKEKKRDLTAAGLLASAAVFLLIIGVFVNGSLSFFGKARSEGEETLRSAIARAVGQGYAIEGRYPPSVEYLEENYGIQIDRER